jgi:hypothetical protein
MCRILLQVLKSLLYTAFFYQGEELGCLFGYRRTTGVCQAEIKFSRMV